MGEIIPLKDLLYFENVRVLSDFYESGLLKNVPVHHDEVLIKTLSSRNCISTLKFIFSKNVSFELDEIVHSNSHLLNARTYSLLIQNGANPNYIKLENFNK